MKTDRIDSDGLWIVTEDDREQRFKDLVGGVAFGDPAEEGDYSLHGFAVIGLDQAGHFILLEEFLGLFEDLGAEAIGLKDRYLLAEVWCPQEPKDFRRRLECPTLDGLTDYDVKGYRNNVKVYKRPGSTWPHFRDRHTRAALIPMPDSILNEIDAFIARVSGMIAAGDVLIADQCLKAKRLQREDFSRGREHPLLRAMVYAIVSLQRKHQPAAAKQKLDSSTCWYRDRWK